MSKPAFEALCYAIAGGAVLVIVLGVVLAGVFNTTGIGTDKREDDGAL